EELRRRTQIFYLPAYLLVHSTPSLADGALARSLMMPAPTEKSTCTNPPDSCCPEVTPLEGSILRTGASGGFLYSQSPAHLVAGNSAFSAMTGARALDQGQKFPVGA